MCVVFLQYGVLKYPEGTKAGHSEEGLSNSSESKLFLSNRFW